MNLFPYTPRAGQTDVRDLAHRTFAEAGHAVVESGTGTGKTVAVLTAALEHGLQHGHRVLYLTRTNSQQRQVIHEFRRIRETGGLPVHAVGLQGRRHLCTLTDHTPEFGRATSEELAMLCRDAQEAARDEAQGKTPKVTPCQPYARTTDTALDHATTWARDHAPTTAELVDEARDQGICPYVVTRELLPTAQVVAAPYVYLFHPFLRDALLRWTGARIQDLHVVVDEAHNLPDVLRDLASTRLTHRSLAIAKGEARDHGDIQVPTGGTITSFLATLQEAVRTLADDHVPPGEEDGLLPPGALETEVLSALTSSTRGLDATLAVLGDYGQSVREAKRREAKTPRSYVGRIADVLAMLRSAHETTHIKLAVGGDNPAVEVACLDPGELAEPLREAHGSVLMSGTLRPLEQVRDTLHLPSSTRLEEVPSPFPPEHRLLLYDESVTTRYEAVRRDPTMWKRIAERLQGIREANPVSTAVFFPSYDVLHRITKHLPRDPDLVEEHGASQDELMGLVTEFKEDRGRVLYSVMGGRISEGLDFPHDALELAVIVGLPYPRPTARQEALRRYHDHRYGKGWEYAVHAPMARRVLQSLGRLIRTPTDRGVGIILDRRAGVLDPMLPRLRATADPAAEAASFLGHATDTGRFK